MNRIWRLCGGCKLGRRPDRREEVLNARGASDANEERAWVVWDGWEKRAWACDRWDAWDCWAGWSAGFRFGIWDCGLEDGEPGTRSVSTQAEGGESESSVLKFEIGEDEQELATKSTKSTESMERERRKAPDPCWRIGGNGFQRQIGGTPSLSCRAALRSPALQRLDQSAPTSGN